MNKSKYIIVLNKNCNKDEFKSELQGVSNQEYIPNRECEIVDDVVDTRGLVSILSEQEAVQLSKDPRIQGIQRDMPQILTNIPPILTNHQLLNSGLCPKLIDKKVNNVSILKEYESKEKINENNINIQSLTHDARINDLPDGSGVDVVIVDTLIGCILKHNIDCSPEFFGVLNPELVYRAIYSGNIVHPDLRDKNGNSRVNHINWNSYVGEPGEYDYAAMASGSLDIQDHGLHVAGTACGNRQGWAKNSQIYNIAPNLRQFNNTPFLFNNFKFLTAIKNWHLDKSNHPESSGRPTITNHSYGYSSDYFYDIRSILSVTISGIEMLAPRETSVATVEATINSNGFIDSYTVTNSGEGYTNLPTISFNGGGGDEAEFVMGSGSIKTIVVTDIGSGYDHTNPPTITFDASPDGNTASGVCVVNSGDGSISRIIMSDRGTGYSESSPPNITFSDPVSGTTAAAYCIIKSNFISNIKIINWVDNNYWRPAIGFFCDPPQLVIAGGSPTKEAMWRINPDPAVNGGWHTGSTMTDLDTFYEIVEKRTQLTSTSFSQNLLGGEYQTKPAASFSYNLFKCFHGGPYAWASIVDGKIVAVSGNWHPDPAGGGYCQPGSRDCLSAEDCPCPDTAEGYRTDPDYYNFDNDLLNPISCPSGWFTSNPQVYITNGGGFTDQYLQNLGVRVNTDVYAWTFAGDRCLTISDKYVTKYIGYHSVRNILMDSIIEDLVDNGVVVVGAAGNLPDIAYRSEDDMFNTKLTINFCYFLKQNPTIPCDGDNMVYEGDASIGRTYATWMGGLPWGDNIYDDYPLQGSSPGAANGSICVGSYTRSSNPEQKSSFSVTGPRIDIWAPGESIISSTYINKQCSYNNVPNSSIKDHRNYMLFANDPVDQRFGLARLNGTSIASPQVCGAIASYFTDGNVTRSSNIPEQALNWLTNSVVSYIAESGFPRNLSGGTSGILHFPGITVTYA